MKRLIQFLARPLAALLLTAAALPALAQSVIAIKESDTVIVPVSIRDQTRIRLERGRVVDVLGDVYDANLNPSGRVTVIKDEDGEVYVKPLIQPAGVAAVPGIPYNPLAPIKLDLKTSQGGFGLLLQPIDQPGNTVILRAQAGVAAPAVATGPKGKSSSHVRQVKAMVLAMANPAFADSTSGLQQMSVREVGQEIALWREARFVLQREYTSATMVAQTFELTNVSKERMVIDERELFTDGVIAVSALRLILEPGESTPVWIVRQTPNQD